MISPILHPAPKARGPQSSRVKAAKLKIEGQGVGWWSMWRYGNHVGGQYPVVMVGGGGGGGGGGEQGVGRICVSIMR
jgi:hypothetical protein